MYVEHFSVILAFTCRRADGYSISFAYAGVAQLVEHNVANVVVVGSNPIARLTGRPSSDLDGGRFLFPA